MLTRRTLIVALAAGATTSAFAADYPARPIRMIAPFTPGSPVDVVARLLAQHLSAELKQGVAPAMYTNLDYDPLKSFAPVANVAWGSWVTVMPPSLPVHSAPELIAYAKAHPGTLNFGYGQGTAPQLVGEWFNKTQGLQIAGVPYK